MTEIPYFIFLPLAYGYLFFSRSRISVSSFSSADGAGGAGGVAGLGSSFFLVVSLAMPLTIRNRFCRKHRQ